MFSVSNRKDDWRRCAIPIPSNMTTSGYRCVNYFELCRLCTSSAGEKTHIFSEDGRKKDLLGKISVCLPVVVSCFFLRFLSLSRSNVMIMKYV